MIKNVAGKVNECAVRHKILVEKPYLPDAACRRYATFTRIAYNRVPTARLTGENAGFSTNIQSLTGLKSHVLV
ncbi:MAG: hypothetical protein LBE91_21435 [Tannerella sp.]|nr:hypothetical protein [Tannerella sp.]